MRVISFLKQWMLPLAMTSGAAAYLIYDNIPSLKPAGPYLAEAVGILQPLLIFAMLFLSFCKISPKDMKPRKWHLKLLIFQGGIFTLLAIVTACFPEFDGRILIESAMLCIICPTATAAAVVTGRLGGDMPGLTTYTVLINITAGLLVPLMIPLVHPEDGVPFSTAFSMIMAKVFPLLICPCLAAWLVRYLMPKVHNWLTKFSNLAFYLWGIALTIAIATTTKSIIHSTTSIYYEIGIALVSLLCCAIQFFIGKKIGKRYNASITAGQSLGQKNTVFAIWMGYTFMTPATSIAGGFYCIWHNAYNSWQLYRKEKSTPGSSGEPLP